MNLLIKMYKYFIILNIILKYIKNKIKEYSLIIIIIYFLK
jgi:hypothetical protein